MLAAFILFLREGLEASLLISIFLAALRQLGRTQEMRAVWIGVILAVAAALGGGIVLYATVRQYDGSTFQTIFETITYFAAIVILTGMTFWMQAHSRTLSREITEKAASSGSAFALGLLAFTTVGREGLETAVFGLAFAFQTNGVLFLTGGLLGIAAAVGLSILIYRMGYRLNFRVFFRAMGLLLLIFAAGLVADVIQNVQELGWVRLGMHPLWNTSGILSEDSTLGDILHTFLGYAAQPTVLQAIAYGIFLLIAGGLFYRITRKPAIAIAPAQ
jgi:high-affinity iron transporter